MKRLLTRLADAIAANEDITFPDLKLELCVVEYLFLPNAYA